VGRRNEYHPKSGDALRLGSKGRYGLCVDGVIALLHTEHFRDKGLIYKAPYKFICLIYFLDIIFDFTTETDHQLVSGHGKR